MEQQAQGGQIPQANSWPTKKRATNRNGNRNRNGTTKTGGGLVESSKQTQYHSQVGIDRDGGKTEQWWKSLTQQVIAVRLPGLEKAKAKSEGNRTKSGQVGVRARPETTHPTTNRRRSSWIEEIQGQIAQK